MTRREIEKEIKGIRQLMDSMWDRVDSLQDNIENDEFYDILDEVKSSISNSGKEFSQAVGIYQNGDLDDELE